MMAPGRRSFRRSLAWWSALAIAAVVIVLWNGNPRMLDPSDATWINGDDPLAHVMGWEQFRASPLVQYPITRNDGYGLERGSSLVYSDSIPVAALIVRPFSPLLPHPFQYLGWFAVLSVLLQGYWGARLIRLRSNRLSHAVLGAGFFMIAPTLLNRIGLHTSLTSQWLLLCALWLYFSSREPQARRWALLLLLTISIHAYLFIMIGAFWAANLVKCRMARTLGRRDLVHAALTMAGVVAWMHVIGYFVVGKGAAAGGGTTRFDLINFIAGMSWNTILPVVYGNPEPNAWDGYAYLGTGLMAVLVASIVAAVARRLLRRRASSVSPVGPVAAVSAAEPGGHVKVSWAPLIAVAVFFFVFATSNTVLLNGHRLVHYPWPPFMRTVTETFRGGGRMIWPTYYVIVLAILWLAIRSWPPRAVAWVMAAGLAVNAYDFRGGAQLMRTGVTPRGDQGPIQPLRDPLWTTIAGRYRKIVSIPAFHGQPDRQTLSWFCAMHGIATNIGYFGRISADRQEKGAQRALDQLLHGTYDPDTVYSFPYAAMWNVAKRTASPHDLAVIADGHYLLLPGGNPGGTVSPGDSAVSPPLDTWLEFSGKGTAGGLLLEGWSWREDWGAWSDAKTASFLLPLPRGYRGKLRIALRWLGHARAGGKQKVHIWFDDKEFQVWFEYDLQHLDSTFDVIATRDFIPVRLRIRDPITESDGRRLAVGMIAARLSNPDDPNSPPPEPPDLTPIP
jgi:hypothetical protein